ncbi:hypothetical protein [Sphingopyxis fribergensis]
MISSLLPLSVALLSPAAPPPAAAASPPTLAGAAKDVAHISTDVCLRLATGELRWTPRDLQEEIAQIEAAGLVYGIPPGVIDTLGPAGKASVNRSTMASRRNGDFVTLLALNGAIPGCRVLLAGDDRPGMIDAVAAALTAARWTPLPAFTSKTGGYEQRLFMRSENKTWYRLDLATNSDTGARLRVLIDVSSASRPDRPPLGTVAEQ